jgi:hypothetical protein
MSDQSQVSLCIMGRPDDVHEVKALLSDDSGGFNPFNAFAMDEVIDQIPSWISPKKGENRAEYKKRMLNEYHALQSRQSGESRFRFHHGPVLNQEDFPGISMVDKEICSFNRTWFPPIREIATISLRYSNVAFAMDFDSSMLSHAGAVYTSRGDVWHSNYKMHNKDFYGFDIMLDLNFDFRYKTKFGVPGMIVPHYRLKGIGRNFVKINSDDMEHLQDFFPHPCNEDLGICDLEYLHDNYVPVIYEPSPDEIRQYWDEKLAEVIDRQTQAKQITNLFNTNL